MGQQGEEVGITKQDVGTDNEKESEMTNAEPFANANSEVVESANPPAVEVAVKGVKQMRKWRVGTVSMGLSLVFLGVLLFLQQVMGMSMMEPILIWWPLILIVLGLEIILYLLFSKQENPKVRYDFVSILFIALLGSVAIVFTAFSSFGLMGELQAAMHQEMRTYTLPDWEETISAELEHIVVVTGNQWVKIDGTQANELHILGTYRTTAQSDLSPGIVSKDQVAFTKIVGNTIYVYMKEADRKAGLFSNDRTYISATIVVPERLELEVRGNRD